MSKRKDAVILGVIPARGGSKGVPRKNIRTVGGRPLIAYAIEAASRSRMLTEFVVSTDDKEIARVSESLGARVLMRPSALAADDTPMVPSIQHVVNTVEQDSDTVDIIVLMQPTAPARISEDVDGAINKLMDTGADSVLSVYKVEDQHPSRMYRIRDDRLIRLLDEPGSMLRQELEPVYHRNGAIYACTRATLMEKGTFVGSDVRPYVMPRERSINIDDEWDLMIADFILGGGSRL